MTDKPQKLSKYTKALGTPGKTRIRPDGKRGKDTGQVNYTAAELREKRRREAEERNGA